MLNGKTVPIPKGYHQGITNEFRKEWPYGTGKIPSDEVLEEIMNRVYGKYPIPGFPLTNPPLPTVTPSTVTPTVTSEVVPEVVPEINFEMPIFW